jgi:hypothetical protein
VSFQGVVRSPGAPIPADGVGASAHGRRYSQLDGVVAVVTRYSCADVVERLFRDFGERISLAVIVEVVHECREQLSGVAESAMNEMLERLARQRLNATP